MNDLVSVPHNAIFSLCSNIHFLINRKQEDLDYALKAEEASPFRKALADSLVIRRDLNNLKRLLGLALNCAPDDVKDFFIHYDEIVANCPF